MKGGREGMTVLTVSQMDTTMAKRRAYPKIKLYGIELGEKK